MNTSSETGILCIQTGGTIDKVYPKTKGGYAFEIGEPAVKKIFGRVKPTIQYRVVTVCQKDSQDIKDSDRDQIVTACREAPETKILITHGTDTLIQTAEYLSKRLNDKTVVLTGSFLPESFKDTDADFNVGVAVGCLQASREPGVLVAMNGRVSDWAKCKRDIETNMFTSV